MTQATNSSTNNPGAVAVRAPQLELGLPELFRNGSIGSKVFKTEETKDADGNVTGEKATLLKREDIAAALGLDKAKDAEMLDEHIQIGKDELKRAIAQALHALESDPNWTGNGFRFKKGKPSKTGKVTNRIYASLETVVRKSGPSDEQIAAAWTASTGIKVTGEDIAKMREAQLKKIAGGQAGTPPIEAASNNAAAQPAPASAIKK